jgi:hypothetical protein
MHAAIHKIVLKSKMIYWDHSLLLKLKQKGIGSGQRFQGSKSHSHGLNFRRHSQKLFSALQLTVAIPSV